MVAITIGILCLCVRFLIDYTNEWKRDCDPVDAVVTWVTSNPVQWKKSFETHCGSKSKNNSYEVSSTRYTRKNTSDDFELKWCLRSILSFAPWIRTVHLVVADGTHIPSCLTLFSESDLRKINIVYHDQIFGNHCSLPSFNSNAIETRLHHIPGLAERFIYFNDDTYLGQPMIPDHFFEGNRPVFWNNCRWPAPSGADKSHFSKIVRNTMTKGNISTSEYRFNHLPIPMTRSLMRKYETLFVDTCNHRCRYDQDIIPMVLVTSLGVKDKRIVSRDESRRNVRMLYTTDWKAVRDYRPHMFCINDNTDEEGLENLFVLLGLNR